MRSTLAWIGAMLCLSGCSGAVSTPISPAGDTGAFTGKHRVFEAYDDYVSTIKQLGDIVVTHKTYGGDYDIPIVVLGDASKPAVVLTGCLHARNEKGAASVVINLLRHYQGHPLLDTHCVVAVPIVNVWGYFASPEGMHFNNHPAPVEGIDNLTWHDPTEYAVYKGVNLNRNFDCNWEAYPNIPWSVKSYWNGRDYGAANYFMMPYARTPEGEVYDPEGKLPGHILKPDQNIYDYKGDAPFSEPETQMIRELFERFHVVAYFDVHTMNPWQTNNSALVSRRDMTEIRPLIDSAIRAFNQRHRRQVMPPPSYGVLEEYDHSAPYATHWAKTKMGVATFSWESGTNFPEHVWLEAYHEVYTRGIDWAVTHPNP